MGLLLINFLKARPGSDGEIIAYNMAMKILDDYIIIPCALGCLLTGILFAVFTNWGFFKFRWLIVKWVVTVASILFGTFFLGPWLNGAAALAQLHGLQALQDQTYIYYRQMNSYFGPLQAAALIALLFVSTLKPWGKRGKSEPLSAVKGGLVYYYPVLNIQNCRN